MSNNTRNVCNILSVLFSRAVKTNYYNWVASNHKNLIPSHLEGLEV